MSQTQRGLTLLELVVVMVILAALAGTVIPLLPNLLGRAHGASGADAISEIAKTVQLHEALYNTHPSMYDSLVDENGDLIIDDGGAQVVVAALTATQAAALEEIGVVNAANHLSASTNLTFEPYDTPIDTLDLTTAGGDVVTLTATGIAALNLEATGSGINSYVVFGIGAACTAVGKSMVDAPLHFLDDGSSPSEEYARMLVVYAIPSASGGKARLAAVCAMDEEGLAGLAAHIGEYHDSVD